MSIPFTPFRVALVTGLVVFASIGAPRIAGFRDSVREKIEERIGNARGYPIPASAQAATAPLIKYKDNSGRTFYVSSEDAVPAQYRSRAELNPRLPKVTYSDFPIQELRKPKAKKGDSDGSELPLLSQNRKPSGDGQVNNFSSSGSSNGNRSGGAEGKGKGGRGGGDNGDDYDDSDEIGLDGNRGGDRIGFIKKWLYFVRDTFNEASDHLSGRRNP